MVGAEGPRMLRLAARYGDLWNTGYMGKPQTMKERLATVRTICQEVGRDPATLGNTAFVGLWFRDLLPDRPSFFPNPLTGTPQEIATAMKGYEELGTQHIMFQLEPYTSETRRRLTEALQLYLDEKSR